MSAHRAANKLLDKVLLGGEGNEPIAWLRDLDGTGSLHPCVFDDPGAFPVYARSNDAQLIEALEKAYGILWRDTGQRSAEMSIAARKELFAVITKDGQKRGIEHALAVYGPVTEEEATLTSEQEEAPLTDIQRSIRDGTFGVRDATDEERRKP
jgi:hypothetical protein